MSPCGVVNCKVLGPQGPLLTNRMREILTYGSVGGVGRKPGPYPAANAGRASLFQSGVVGPAWLRSLALLGTCEDAAMKRVRRQASCGSDLIVHELLF